MKNIVIIIKGIAAFLVLSVLLAFPAVAQPTGKHTEISIEQYSADTDYTGWLDFKIKALSPEGYPVKNLYVVMKKSEDGEKAGQGPGINGDKRFLTDQNGEITFRIFPSPIQYIVYVMDQGRWEHHTYGPYQVKENTSVSITLTPKEFKESDSDIGSGIPGGGVHGEVPAIPGVMEEPSQGEGAQPQTNQGQENGGLALATQASAHHKARTPYNTLTPVRGSDTSPETLPGKGTGPGETPGNQEAPEENPAAAALGGVKRRYIPRVDWLTAIVITLLFVARMLFILAELRRLKKDEGKNGQT